MAEFFLSFQSMLPEFVLSSNPGSFLTLILITIITAIYFYGKSRKLPPGPMGLPLVGYIPFLGKKPHIKLLELKKKYGPVYSLSFGGVQAVILADYAIIKEAFSKDALMGRPEDDILGFSQETIDTEAFSGLPWKQVRRFSLQALRDLGMGKTRLEAHIAEEIQELLNRLELEGEGPISPRKFLVPSVSNVVSSLLFGKRRRFDDPNRLMLDDLMSQMRDLFPKVLWIEFFPLMKMVTKIFPLKSQRMLKKCISQIKEFIDTEIEEHEKSLDPNDPRDFVDRFLLEVKKMDGVEKTVFLRPVLVDAANMFFLAGGETVRSTLEWLILISAMFPDVQKRVQTEIDEVIGNERFPSRADYLDMLYTEATIMETFRWRASFPINNPRYTLEETKIGSYVIPKHTVVIAVNWAAHHNPDLWGEDVEEFKPERFLSSDQKKIIKPEYYMPFSIGKRACIGERLAYVEVFMYFTAILRKFHVRLPEGATPDTEVVLEKGMDLNPYEVYFQSRS